MHKKSLFRHILAKSFAISIIARLVQLSMAILLARQLGVVGYGTFTFSLGLAVIAGHIGCLGWPMTLVRFIPEYQVSGDVGRLKGLLQSANAFSLLGPAILAILMAVTPVIFNIREDLAVGLTIGAILTLPMGYRQLVRQKLAAMKKAPLGLLFDELLSPAGTTLFAIVFTFSSVLQVGISYSLVGIVGCVIGSRLFAKALRSDLGSSILSSTNASYHFDEWLSVSLPLTLGLASRMLMNRADTVMLAPLSSIEEVAFYAAAFRLTYILTFPQVVLMTVVAPYFSREYSKGNFPELVAYFRRAMIFSALTSVPLAGVLIIFAKPLITAVFGGDFSAAVQPLIFLTVGQAAAALLIPLSSILMVSGKHHLFGKITLYGLLANICLNIYLIPRLGASGAAIAGLVTSLLLLSTSIWLVRRHFKSLLR